MKVKLRYFKDSGKYYSSGEYETQKEHMFEIFEEVRGLRDQGKLPDLVEGSTFHTLVECPEHPQNYPGFVFRKGTIFT